MATQFYSYLWLRKDETPYYVGKGCRDRAFSKKHSVRPPKDRSRILIFMHANEAEAFESEKAFIKWFGRKDNGTGILRNLTDGGEGPSGQILSMETRNKMRNTALQVRHFHGKHHSDATKAVWRDLRKGKCPPAHVLEASNRANRGRKNSPATRAQMAEAAKRRPPSPLRGRKRPAEVHKQGWDTRFLKTVAWG